MDNELDQPASESHEEWALRRKRERMIVTPLQAQAALMQLGYHDAAAVYIAEHPDPMVRLAWEKASRFERLSPMIASAAAALGLTPEALDEIFIVAAAVRV